MSQELTIKVKAIKKKIEGNEVFAIGMNDERIHLKNVGIVKIEVDISTGFIESITYVNLPPPPIEIMGS